MEQKIILSVSVITLFISCNSNKKKTIDTSSIKIDGVSLDNTKLWQANLETTGGIKKMQSIMRSFSKEENVSAYASLKGELEVEFTNIFQKMYNERRNTQPIA